MNTKTRDLVSGEFYHIFNKGVDGRLIFEEDKDIARFYQSMDEFNTIEPIGSIYENSFIKNQLGRPTSKLIGDDNLVNIIAYCLNPNHFHFILEQVTDGGISEFMKRMGGYTKYINNKLKRKGPLFSGSFNFRHIDDNEYLLHLSAYVNLNDRVHQLDQFNQLGRPTSKLINSKSSWLEYINNRNTGMCKKNIVLDQFDNAEEYKKMAEEKLEDMILRKRELEFE